MNTAPTVSALDDLRNSCGDRFNIAEGGKSFDCKFIEPGLVNYRDQGGGLELLRKETIDKCIASAIGNPLTVGHVMVNAANRMEVEEGIVHECYYNSESGWYHVKGSADTTRAQRLMSLKKPSCGYQVTSFGPGGVYHGIRYDKEITGIKFNHLAIVDKPRYEDAVFRFNSMNLFKVIYKLLVRTNGADGKTTEAVEPQTLEIPGDALVSVGDKEVRFNDLGALWMKQTADAVHAKPTGESMIDCGPDCGEVKLNELIETYKSTKGKRTNAAADEAKLKADADAAAALKTKTDAEAFARLNAARNTVAPAPANTSSSGSLADRQAKAKAAGY